MELGTLVAAGSEEAAVPLSEVKELKAGVGQLERLFLGKKTLEVEILKDAIEIASEKKLILRVPWPIKDDTPEGHC